MEVDAQAIAKLLGGRREGAAYLCHCPVKGHGKGRGDRRPSLGVSDGDKGLVVHCFAGCTSTAVLAALRSLSPTGQLPKRLSGLDNRRTPKTTSDYVRRLWRASADPLGTPVAVFLRERGLPPDPPATIRYLPSYRYDRAKPKSALPCMIAAVQASSREIVAVQITFLHSWGRRKADVEHPRPRDRPACCGWRLQVLAWDALKGLRKHGPLNFSSGNPCGRRSASSGILSSHGRRIRGA